MRRRSGLAVAALVGAVAAAAAGFAGGASPAGKPPAVGGALDRQGAMAPVHCPALTAAQRRVAHVDTNGASPGLATDAVTVYFKNIAQAGAAGWKQLGGKVVAQETCQSLGSNNVQNAVSRLNGVKADVIVPSTAGGFGALATLVSGLRTLGG